jgi:hypothetical protein
LYPLLAAHSETPPLPTPDPAQEDRVVYAYAARSLSELRPGRRSKAQAGDFVIGNRLVRFVVGGLHSAPGFYNFTGYLLDAGRAGRPGDLLGAAVPVLESRGLREQPRYRKVEVVSDGRDGPALVRATGDTRHWPSLKVTTEYQLGAWDEHLVIKTTLENSGAKLRLKLGDYVKWTNSNTFFPGKGFRLRRKSHSSDWVARRGSGSSFGWFVSQGKLVSLVLTSHQGSRYNSAMRIYVKSVKIPTGEKATYTRNLAVGQGDVADVARVVFQVRGESATKISGTVTGVKSGKPLAGVRVRAYTPRGRALVTEADTDKDGRFEMLLHPGKYRLVAWEWGRSDSAPLSLEVGKEEQRGLSLRLRPPGRVSLEVRSEIGGELLPARLIFLGKGRTKTPKFVPEREDRQVDNVIYTHTGRGTRNVPPGDYHVIVTRGPEYTLSEHEVRVRSGETTSIVARLARVVDTNGFIACDFHLHSVNSQDSLVGLEDRIRSLVSENIEFAVPTDHNHVTDYRPIIQELGLRRFISSIPGSEVTTDGFVLGHFNVFPLEPEAGTPGEGAIAFHRRLPREIFAEVRARPGSDRVIQVNHPRLNRGNGYWNDVGWVGRAGAARSRRYSPDFDAIEVFNGLDRTLARTDRVLKEWFVLLNRGYRYTATGNSDSHRLGFEEVGYPRNFVAVSDDNPERVDPQELVASVKAGRVVVTNGPFVRVRAVSALKDGSPAQGSVGATPSGGPSPISSTYPRPPTGPAVMVGTMGELVKSGPGGVILEVEAQAAPWVDVRTIEIVANGSVVSAIPVPKTHKVLRYKGSVRFQPTSDTWYVVLVRGEDPLLTVPRRKVPPLAITNPIWVDANADGKFRTARR